MSWHALPNLITSLRIALALPLLLALNAGRHELALAIAAIAAASDVLDGWLARRFGWQSRLGGLLDPLADKLLLNTAFLALWLAQAVPSWMLALVFARDAVIVGGAIGWRLRFGDLEAEPTSWGKAATAAQLALVLVLLLGLVRVGLPPALIDGVALATTALTLASGLDYVQTWSRRAYRVGFSEDEGS